MTELHVVEHLVGSGSGSEAPLAVLIHGTMDRSTSFNRAMSHIDDVSLIAYDRRGYARSRFATPPAVSVADHVDDLLDIVGERRVFLVGHSYGGDVALAAAVRRPDLVRAVGAYEPPMPWTPEWPSDTAGGDALKAALRSGDSDAAVEAFLRRMLGDETWEMMPRRAREDRLGEGPALLSDMRSLRPSEGPPPLDPAEVAVPVVIAYGSKSREHQIANSRRMLGLIPDVEEFVFDGAGHGGHLTHPDQFAQFIRRVISRAPDPA